MIRIYYTSFHTPLHTAAFADYLNAFPFEIQKKILRFRKWQDAHASLFGKLLLKKGLQDLHKDANLFAMKYTGYGRPYFENGIDFNISHSGNHIVCAFADRGSIGIDIEEVKPIAVEDFKGIFIEEEWLNILVADDPSRTFFRYWTAKESIVKALGIGLNAPLKQVHIREETASLGGSIWYCKNISLFENYMLHIAFDQKPDNICLKKLCF